MFETVNLIRTMPGHNMVTFVHDDESDFEELHQLYRGFRKLES